MTITTMQDAINAHEKAGGFFFSPGAMEFFDSAIEHDTFDPATGYFITTEVCPGPVGRHWRIRRIDLANPADIDSLDDMYVSKAAAVEAMSALTA